MLNSLFSKISRLGLGQAFSCEFCETAFWCSTSSVEFIGSNQGIAVLINVIIGLYNLVVKVFHNSVKD